MVHKFQWIEIELVFGQTGKNCWPNKYFYTLCLTVLGTYLLVLYNTDLSTSYAISRIYTRILSISLILRIKNFNPTRFYYLANEERFETFVMEGNFGVGYPLFCKRFRYAPILHANHFSDNKFAAFTDKGCLIQNTKICIQFHSS